MTILQSTSNCVGCVDPNASNTNLEYLVNNTALDCSAESYTDLDDADLSCCVYTSFSFNQSMNQSAYFFSDVKIDGVSAEVGVDEIYAFNGDVCVGGGTWNGPNVEVMLMGDDGEPPGDDQRTSLSDTHASQPPSPSRSMDWGRSLNMFILRITSGSG